MMATSKNIILKDTSLTHFLLDASGVLYTDKGPIPEIATTVEMLQKRGDVYIATNNSSFSINHIQKKLKSIGISIQKDHIISSGLGLRDDEECHSLIKGKRVYLFGYKKSLPYVIRTQFKAIVPHPSLADIILLTSSYKENVETEYKKLVKSLKETPKPIICCNPDHTVVGKHTLIHVIGFYASKLQIETQLPILWFGKPYTNYSKLVANTLTSHYPMIDFTKCIFFDDNLHNVIRIQTDLGIQGCWIKDSGISNSLPLQETVQSIGRPSYIIPSL